MATVASFTLPAAESSAPIGSALAIGSAAAATPTPTRSGVEYVTAEGDRWDLIAWRMYGDAYAFEEIVKANPHVPVRPVLPSGLRLLVPLRPRPTVGGLPPWKRSA